MSQARGLHGPIKGGLPGLKDRSKHPKSHPETVPEEIARLIVKLRQKSQSTTRCSIRDKGFRWMPNMCPKSDWGIAPSPIRSTNTLAIDDCTKLRFVWVYQELCPASSVDFTRRMLNFFPFPIEEVQTDHGAEFTYTYIFMPWVKKPHPFEAFLKGDSFTCKQCLSVIAMK